MFLMFLMLELLVGERNTQRKDKKQPNHLKMLSLNVNGSNNPIKRGESDSKVKKGKKHVNYMQET